MREGFGEQLRWSTTDGVEIMCLWLYQCEVDVNCLQLKCSVVTRVVWTRPFAREELREGSGDTASESVVYFGLTRQVLAKGHVQTITRGTSMSTKLKSDQK